MRQKQKILLVIIIFSFGIFYLINPVIFHTLFYTVFQKTTTIPYTNCIGQPQKRLVEQTISYLDDIKKIKDIYIKEKKYLNERYGFEYIRKVVDKETLLVYNIPLKNFELEIGTKTYNFYEHYRYNIEIFVSKNPKKYVLFSFNYPIDLEKDGLWIHYGFFYDSRKDIELKNQDYQSVVSLGEDWYFFVKTEVYENSDIWSWNKIESTNKNFIWEGIPPIDYVIRPYNHKKIRGWVKNLN